MEKKTDLSEPIAPEELKRRSIRGVGILLGSETLLFVLHMATTIVLARLILPDSFGLVASITAITGFVSVFKELGLSSATVQRANITHAQVSTLFWLNLVLGIVLTILVVMLAPALAWFYDDPRLTRIALVLASAFLLSGLAPQHMALLRRGLRFGTIAGIKIFATVGQSVVGIGLALMGAEYWALVAMSVSFAFLHTLALWVATDWRPARPVRGAGTRPMIRFGSELTGSRLLHYVSRNLDNVLIAKYVSPAALGLYSKAYQLLLLPNRWLSRPVSSVAIPALSRLQGDPVRYKRYYQGAIEQIVFFSMPLVVFMFIEAGTLVRVLLGPNWMGAVPLFQVLAPAAFIGTFNAATGWVYLTLGHTDRQLRWVMFGSTVRTLAFLVGIRWGVMGIAVAFTVSTCILRGFGIAYCFKPTPLRVRDLGESLWRSAATSLLAGLGSLGGLHYWPMEVGLVRLLAVAVLYAVLYFIFWLLLPGGRSRLMTLFKRMRELIGYG